jgi:hypothetical protein
MTTVRVLGHTKWADGETSPDRRVNWSCSLTDCPSTLKTVVDERVIVRDRQRWLWCDRLNRAAPDWPTMTTTRTDSFKQTEAPTVTEWNQVNPSVIHWVLPTQLPTVSGHSSRSRMTGRGGWSRDGLRVVRGATAWSTRCVCV